MSSYSYPSVPYFSGFGLRKLYIAPQAGVANNGSASSSGASVSTWYRIPGAVAINGTMGAKSVDQYGDDQLLNIWIYDRRMGLDLETSMTVPYLNQILTGNLASYLSASTVNDQVNSVIQYFGTELEETPPHFMLRAESELRLEGGQVAGSPGTYLTPTSASQFLRLTWFNCQITNVVGPENLQFGQVQNNRYRVEALPAYYDEYGTSLANVPGAGALTAIAKAEWGFQPNIDGGGTG